MFDYVKYEADCLNCGQPLHDFQSKDGDRLLANLTPMELYIQSSRGNAKPVFYAYCEHCELFDNYNEFEVSHPSNIWEPVGIMVRRTDGTRRN